MRTVARKRCLLLGLLLLASIGAGNRDENDKSTASKEDLVQSTLNRLRSDTIGRLEIKYIPECRESFSALTPASVERADYQISVEDYQSSKFKDELASAFADSDVTPEPAESPRMGPGGHYGVASLNDGLGYLDVNMQFSDQFESEEGRSFVAKLKNLGLHISDGGDFRWACIFCDAAGHRVLTMYFRAGHTSGRINGVSVRLNGCFVKTLNKRCADIFKHNCWLENLPLKEN